MSRRLKWMLVVVLVLAAANLWRWLAPGAPQQQRGPAGPAMGLDWPWPQALKDGFATKRNIFEFQRTVKVKPKTAATAKQGPRLKLLGLALRQGAPSALFDINGSIESGGVSALLAGGRYRIEKIDADSATLRDLKQNRSQTFTLSDGSNP